MQDYIVRPTLAHGAGRDRCEFIWRTGEAVSGHHQTGTAHLLQSHAATSVRSAGKKQRQRERQLTLSTIRAIRRARSGTGEGHARHRKHHRRDARAQPVYVRDVADVKIGSELRQGAVTANGKGEVVAGIVMMLKGASGRDVVNAVKEKLPAIQKALPKGVELVPFYDRTDLVKKAIHTVTKALGEGAIFVLIILIVLLADVRSAIIVTLVLPLAALFAFIMMKWYGLERESDVVRRSRHRHRHDGRWRGRHGGKHPSTSHREA